MRPFDRRHEGALPDGSRLPALKLQCSAVVDPDLEQGVKPGFGDEHVTGLHNAEAPPHSDWSIQSNCCSRSPPGRHRFFGWQLARAGSLSTRRCDPGTTRRAHRRRRTRPLHKLSYPPNIGVAAQETSDFAGHEIVHYGVVLVAKNGGVDLLNRELATDGGDDADALAAFRAIQSNWWRKRCRGATAVGGEQWGQGA